MTRPKVILHFFDIRNACMHVFLCPFLFSSQGYQVAWDFSSVPGFFVMDSFSYEGVPGGMGSRFC